MKKTFKYRLYPNKKMKKILNQNLKQCRFIYNYILNMRIEKYKKENISISKYDINKIITQLKKENVELKNIYSQILQNVSDRVDKAYKNFFNRVQKGETPGFPRFKKHNRYRSFTYPQNNGSFKIIDDKWLHLSKIGKIQIKLHRPLYGDIKTCSIKKTNTNKWYVYFTFECDEMTLPTSNKEVGIDMGIKTFAYFSDKEIIENPKTLKKSEKKLKKYQSKFSKEKKGTEKRKKFGKILCKIHEKIKNQRDDFLHKSSRYIVNKYQVICIEDLRVKDMIKKDKSKDNLEKHKDKLRNKNILDVSWSTLTQYLSYKAEEAGRDLILVNPRNTSKTCSGCGNLVPKGLNDRIHRCDKCGLDIDRDYNASLNILRLGLESLEVNAS